MGVVAQVTPWNYPLMSGTVEIGPALAAGNTVVLKPSDTTPESTLELAKLIADIFPAGFLMLCSVLALRALRWLIILPPRWCLSPGRCGQAGRWLPVRLLG